MPNIWIVLIFFFCCEVSAWFFASPFHFFSLLENPVVILEKFSGTIVQDYLTHYLHVEVPEKFFCLVMFSHGTVSYGSS